MISEVKENEKKIKALIITHGHEDHIGGISFLLQNVSIPVIYAPRIAASLIKNKLVDNHLDYQNIESFTKESVLKFKNFLIIIINKISYFLIFSNDFIKIFINITFLTIFT